jgi:hypothetical protein
VTDTLQDISRIAQLLRYSTSRKVVEDFLQSKRLPHTARNWEDFINERIIGSVEKNQLSSDDFLKLLSSVEECGKQHVFLYSCVAPVAERLLDETRVLTDVKNANLEHVYGSPLALDTPDTPTIVDIRLEKAVVPLTLVVKEVYTHRAYKAASSKEEGDELTKVWRIIRTRAVNIAKLHRDGLLEIRLASVSESSYKVQRERFLKMVGNLIPIHLFAPVNLAEAKKNISVNKLALSSSLRFADTILRNENGTIVKVSSGSSADNLAEDEGALASEGGFLLHNGAYADGQNFFIRPVSNLLSKETPIIMSGELNEFGITAQCSEADYNYVISEIRKLNS